MIGSIFQKLINKDFLNKNPDFQFQIRTDSFPKIGDCGSNCTCNRFDVWCFQSRSNIFMPGTTWRYYINSSLPNFSWL